jgi:hypothetical protein
MYEKFGKSFKDIAALKTSFFQENEKHLQRSLHYAGIYTQQPLRLRCKICDTTLPSAPSFVKHAIPYVLCPVCGQLNGMHEDSDAFCKAVYTSEGGKEYAENYTEKHVDAYARRREAIYTPKAEFLLDVLRKEGENPESLSYADMGAGAGYFVSALMELGLRNVTGYEVGETQVNLGKWVTPNLPLNVIGLQDTEKLVRTQPADVVSFIGVFEHLQNPRAILAALKSNPSVKYFYFCVPMFSPTIFGEMVFPEVMPRQLTVGHTHLFTESSLAYFEKEFGFERVGAWWFGTDMMDYYRSVLITLSGKPDLAKMADVWAETFEKVLDDMQLAMDKKRQSSQVHMILRVPH